MASALLDTLRRRREFSGDITRHGGMVAVSTEIAFDTLDKAIRAAGGRPSSEAA